MKLIVIELYGKVVKQQEQVKNSLAHPNEGDKMSKLHPHPFPPSCTP